jgi:hypothetical protein
VCASNLPEALAVSGGEQGPDLSSCRWWCAGAHLHRPDTSTFLQQSYEAGGRSYNFNICMCIPHLGSSMIVNSTLIAEFVLRGGFHPLDTALRAMQFDSDTKNHYKTAS